MKTKSFIYIVLTGLLLSCCIYPFEPDIKGDVKELISIEGDIICGDYSYFSISKTLALDQPNNFLLSLTAEKVYVEEESGTTIAASCEEVFDKVYFQSKKHLYTADTRNIDMNKKYRLVVEMSADVRYMSPFMNIIPTSPIDSVTYKVAEDKHSLQIRVNTISLADSAFYYKWECEENWEFTANIFAQFQWDPENDKIVELPRSRNKYYCWKKGRVTDIVVFSTEKLSENRVSEYPVRTIGYEDDRISYLYCADVIQKSISKEAYDYWSILKKNNDQTGGLFSPQPTEVRGNIISSADSSEHVIGYISACKPTSLRKFISQKDAQNIYRNPKVCKGDTLTWDMWKAAYEYGQDVAIIDPSSGVVVWMMLGCIDCRTYGTKNKPDFWPNKDL